MFIKSLVIESKDGLVRQIAFHQGLNLIVDETPDDNTETGNNVGKTTILRLVDICLGKKPNSIYVSPEDSRRANEQVKNFLTENEVSVSLTLVSNWTDYAKEVRIRRNFLSRGKAINEINGTRYPNEIEFRKALQLATLGVETEKPTYRQLIAHNIRYTNAAVTQTLRCLEGVNSDAVYEALYLYMLGCEYDDRNLRQHVLEELKAEESFKRKLQKEKSRNVLASELGVANAEIEDLESQKRQMRLNPEFDEDMSNLTDLKYEITSLSAQLSSLRLRQSIMEEAKEEILGKKSDIDVESLKVIYSQARRFVPNLHHTFEELIEHHNSMLVKKADFITKDLPAIEARIKSVEEEIEDLRTSESALSQKLAQTATYADLENLISELTRKYEKLGAIKQQISQIDQVEEKIAKLNSQIENINNELFSDAFKDKVQGQLNKLNVHLSKISQLLYGEPYGMIFETYAGKGSENDVYRFDIKRLDSDAINFSSGKKQGEIVCFDMAYILFADKERIPCLHFGLYDKKELLHGNQLLKTAKLLEENANLQFVASILSDKLPSRLRDDKYIVVKLSQKDKLFRF